MIHKHTVPQILFPRTVNEALELMESERDAVFWAGGTALAGSNIRGGTIDLPKVVLALCLVEELSRASRSEQGLEIGAMINLDRLADIGRNSFPPAMPEAIAGIGNRPLRCRATFGGNLMMSHPWGDLRPLLQLLDSNVDIRFMRRRGKRGRPVPAGRKIPLASLDDPVDGLPRGGLITRVNIPAGGWNFGRFAKIRPTGNPGRILRFYAAARIEKNMLAEFRAAFSDGRRAILRDRELETSMAGRRLPLSRRETNAVLEESDIMNDPWNSHAFEKQRYLGLIREFLIECGERIT